MERNDGGNPADAWKRYEAEKAKARRDCLSPEAYEAYIKAAAKRLGL